MNRIIQSESGFAALVALIMVAMLTLLGLAALSTSDDELSIASNEMQEMDMVLKQRLQGLGYI